MKPSRWWHWVIKLRVNLNFVVSRIFPFFFFFFLKPEIEIKTELVKYFYAPTAWMFIDSKILPPYSYFIPKEFIENIDRYWTCFIKSVNAHPSTQFSTNVAPCLWVTNWPSRNRFPIDFCRVVFFSNLLYNTTYDWIISVLQWLSYLK